MEKLDFAGERPDLYRPPKDLTVVDVPPFDFLMIDGHGDPNTSPDYAEALQALYSLAYTLKFASKTDLGRDYTVMPLEGLWYADDLGAFTAGAKDAWSWTMMIRQPVPVSEELWAAARGKAAAKKALPALPAVRRETFAEGLSVQALYVGPYADEGPTITRMHDWIRENGYAENGHHHEIYLGDPRRTRPERLRTVIRQPIRRLSGTPEPAA